MPKTGDPCTEAGVYMTECGCNWKFRFEPPLHFTSCIHCGETVTWRLASAPDTGAKGDTGLGS